MTFKASVAAAAALFVMAGAANAQSEPINFDLINDTEFVLVQLFISVPTTDSWEEDILGAQVVEPGETAAVSIDDGLPECEYDLKATFSNGDELILGSYDFCEVNGGEITVVYE